MCACAATAGVTCRMRRRRSDWKLHAAPSFRLEASARSSPAPGAASGSRRPRALADAGAHVTLAARTANEIEEAAQAIRARGQQADTMVLDVTDLPAMQAAIAAAEPFNILINNAGTNRPEAAPGRHHRRLRRHHGAERARRLFRRAGGGAAADRGEAIRLDHQHLVADGPRRRRAPHRLLRQQARDGGLHQGDGDRTWRRTISG